MKIIDNDIKNLLIKYNISDDIVEYIVKNKIELQYGLCNFPISLSKSKDFNIPDEILKELKKVPYILYICLR